VAIARALYQDPQLLIFDEATSSLDRKNEKAVQDTILGFRGERTPIIIAHRLTTVMGCDAVIWLDEGGIRMTGPPAEVVAGYKKIFGQADEKGDAAGAD